MVKPTVYVESTLPSYLVAAPSRDIVIAGHQRVTHDWWHFASTRFELLISELVLQELGGGRPELATRRLSIVADLPILSTNPDVISLAETYEQQLGLVGKARADLPHFAFCVAYEVDYLVTWNCAHLANAIVLRKLQEVNTRLGLWLPIVCTPEELMVDPQEQV